MAQQVEEPMYQILTAQAANIARIDTDLVLEGTTGTGQQVKLWGPKPDVVRLYDTPMRLIEDAVLENWERIITLSPVTDDEDARIVVRNDRIIRYQVHFAVRLTEKEIVEDRDQMIDGALRPHNPLALKAHRLIYDFHHVFADDIHLEVDDENRDVCTLCDHASYRIAWVPDFEYPMSIFVADVVAQVSGW